ncbi:oxygen-insensitive NAD(P)H nitroreductase [Reinekea marinisedimentorum]|uniref:Nitroreductase/dihydropteridine reductase n=1 Tax=Reinekea marinisedimentorum TaxID=230495 RepID=A0A4R3I284_9GAMM|nr:oxygen-insensitive NAD(P)H nitroreductase [Reinekea marinisedimentorum]TCS38851.1 nitroreductase/dihydropteridine reductase [Reinekea marinisedimentorum]
MNLSEIVKTRYSTKEFDADKKISAEDFAQIKDALRYAPSSVNSQPWHFIIASSEEGKSRMAKGTEGTFAFNAPKILNASHVVLLAARTSIDDDYIEHILEIEDEDGRFADPSFKETVNAGRVKFVGIHRDQLKDMDHWMQKQVYLNMGSLLLAAATIGVDAVPMEGVSLPALNEEFGLLEKGFTAVGVVSFGYRAESDFNANLPKSRLPEEEVFTILD